MRENGNGIATSHALHFEHEHGLAYGILEFAIIHGGHDAVLQCDVVAELGEGTLQVCNRVLNAECFCGAVVGFYSFFNTDDGACKVCAICKIFNGLTVELEHFGNEIFRENLFKIVPRNHESAIVCFANLIVNADLRCLRLYIIDLQSLRFREPAEEHACKDNRHRVFFVNLLLTNQVADDFDAFVSAVVDAFVHAVANFLERVANVQAFKCF